MDEFAGGSQWEAHDDSGWDTNAPLLGGHDNYEQQQQQHSDYDGSTTVDATSTAFSAGAGAGNLERASSSSSSSFATALASIAAVDVAGGDGYVHPYVADSSAMQALPSVVFQTD